MAKDWNIDTVAERIHKIHGYLVTFGGGERYGIGLASMLTDPITRKRVIDKNGQALVTHGRLSKIQEQQYLENSETVDECAQRIIDHIISGKRSDIDLRTQAILDEQARTLTATFQAQIQELKDLMLAKPQAQAAPAIPPSQTVPDLQIQIEAEKLKLQQLETQLVVPDEISQLVERGEPKPEVSASPSERLKTPPPRPSAVRRQKQPFPYTMEKVKEMAAELGMPEEDNKFWKYKVRAKWDKRQKKINQGLPVGD